MGAERSSGRTVGGNALQNLGAAALKPRVPKEVRTKGVTRRSELDDGRERGGIYQLKREER